MPASCEDLVEIVDAMAAGDSSVVLDEEARRHFSECVACRAAVERARQIDRALAQLTEPAAPADLADRVLARVEGERWRAERYVDLGFNVALAAGLVLTLGGVWMLVNLSGLAAAMSDLSIMFGRGLGLVAERASAAAPTVAGAVGFLTTALLVWWWADQQSSLRP
jgi:predicted anti-sigma-YlaC factor YlaD